MGRIRTLKPEWLEDEKLGALDDAARVLSIGLILLADDYGRGRASPQWLDGQVWSYSPQSAAKRGETPRVAAALGALVEMGFVSLYEVAGERFYAIRNWEKHQRIDNRGKPRVPEPCGIRGEPPQNAANRGEPPPDQDQDLGSGSGPSDQGRGAASAPASPSPPPVVPTRDRIAELERRYAIPLAEVRTGCALRRRSGRMADTVWLSVLESLSRHPVAAVEAACRIYLDGHADGDKDERYLLGIVRREARRPPAGADGVRRMLTGRAFMPVSVFTGPSGELDMETGIVTPFPERT